MADPTTSSPENRETADQIASGSTLSPNRPGDSESHVLRALPASLLPKSHSKKKGPSPGIVYISRLPPGMTPQKVKHLMGRWGQVGKVFAQKDDKSKEAKGKSHNVNYSEAWIEFLNKSIAKSAAEMLNAQPIGGNKGEKWRDDIWTMKYLPGFKWEMLGEQIAYERNSHTARLRQELSRSKAEQNEYLRNVDLAKSLQKRKEKKALTLTGETEGEPSTAGDDVGKAKRTYAQRGREDEAGEGGKRGREKKRKTEEQTKKGEAKLSDVLASVF
ncbi:pre-rrna-processing protein esf2 [Phaffia rhodozyma]|uniref:18S rRNA factor 2 n=1 Tax=Phaffia rhodozyma TaxID=264483 RepID=A0A0F7SGT7_PHARH|nr:pre-rrna-processing protein esf2 [Phaffia rhodozyma]